jgi:hypothetical protein
MNLTKEELEVARSGQPLRFTEGQTDFVLIRADVYDRRKLAGKDAALDPHAAGPPIDKMMADDDGNDPALESYLHYGRET